MSRLSLASRGGWLLLALIASACASGVPPVTTLDGSRCAERPDLLGSETTPVLTVSLDKPVTVAMDGQTPCFTPAPGASSAYRVFQLPEGAGEYIITVVSARQGQTLFAPRLMLLDPGGQVIREVPLDAFLFRGSALTANLRSHPGERYLVVASEWDTVGRQDAHLVSTTSRYTSGGPVIVTWTTGQEANDQFTYAHNGSVTVVIRSVPLAN